MHNTKLQQDSREFLSAPEYVKSIRDLVRSNFNSSLFFIIGIKNSLILNKCNHLKKFPLLRDLIWALSFHHYKILALSSTFQERAGLSTKIYLLLPLCLL